MSSVAEKRSKVLVIDDELGPRESLRMVLNTTYTVLCADSVDNGIELLTSENPDVIIMDIRMPGKTGIEGLREIREIDPNISVIMLTGYGALETAQEAIRLGANDYLKKPFDVHEIQEIVAKNIRRSQLAFRHAKAEYDLNMLTEKLNRQIEQKSEMETLGVASSELVHDLRNPLSVVLGYVELMANELREMKKNTPLPAAEEFFTYLEHIEKNAQHCAHLTETWNSLGKGGAMETSPLCLPLMLSDLVEEARHTNPDVQIHFYMPDRTQEIKVDADHVQLHRAFQNILSNAVQAVEDRETKQIELICKHNGNNITIAVTDSGHGIDPENIRWIFEPFYTTKTVNKGTGLGLFITKKVIENHKGEITFESSPDQGTTVTISLPIRIA